MTYLSHGLDAPVPAVRPQPRRRTGGAGVPSAPWGSRRLPRRFAAGDPRRTTIRSLLRRAEGVPVAFADGSTGFVVEVVLPALGFDFWPEALVVATTEGRRRVPVRAVRRIDVRPPLVVADVS